jgi:hypothetical protein
MNKMDLHDRIEFAKRCMETEWKVGLCDDLWCQTTCPYGISLAKGETVCSDSSRKAWAEKVLEEAETTCLYPPSTFTAPPALAEPREEETYFGSGEIHLGDYEMETKQNTKCEQDKELPRFKSKTRGGYEYVIYKIYSEEDSADEYVIHGAVRYSHGWKFISWTDTGKVFDGVERDGDLLPLKKRRFKTAEELVANQYGIVSFNAYGVVEVVQSGSIFRRTKSDTPEGNYSKEWLNVFTIEET